MRDRDRKFDHLVRNRMLQLPDDRRAPASRAGEHARGSRYPGLRGVRATGPRRASRGDRPRARRDHYPCRRHRRFQAGQEFAGQRIGRQHGVSCGRQRRHGCAHLRSARRAGGGRPVFAGDPPRRQSIAIEEAGRFAVEAGPGGGGASPGGGGVSSESGDSELVGVEIRIPCDLLAGGLVLVDTPGVGGLGSPQAAASLAALSMADAALFVTDAEQELAPTELEVLRQARELCDTIACVLTKTDFYPGWRTVRAVDERHLGGSMYPASAPLRLHATETRDAALDAESGFADLVDFLAAQVRGAAARTAARAAADVMVACDLIAGAFEAGRASLTDPVAIEELLDVAKLTGELDHDLRTRIDRVIADLDQAIDGGDPADTWPQMTAWLQSRVSHEAIENFIMLWRRSNDATFGTPATVALKPADAGAFRRWMTSTWVSVWCSATKAFGHRRSASSRSGGRRRSKPFAGTATRCPPWSATTRARRCAASTTSSTSAPRRR